MSIIIALLILSAIVIIHEFGHFLLAKANGIGVTEFAVGMGPILLKTQKGETTYCLKLLPFGGSCMMVGEDADSDDEKAFNNKSVWARISVIAAGPIFNFILAFVLAVVILANVGYDPCRIYEVEQDSAAAQAGLAAGDLITSINGRKVYFSRDYSLYELVRPEKTMEIVYERDGEAYKTKVTPRYLEHDYYQVGITISGLKVSEIVEGMPAEQAGIAAGDTIVSINGETMEDGDDAVNHIRDSKGSPIEMTVEREGQKFTYTITPKIVHTSGYESGITVLALREKTGAFQTVIYSFHEVGYWIRTVFESLGMMFRGQVTADDVSGPVGVVSLIGEVVEDSRPDGWFYMFLTAFNMACMLSANLGVMNLLPIPALDGGRLVFLLIEGVRGKPINREKEGMVHFVGLVVLMIVMVLVTFKDITNLFH
jgi:regulator of sigma E protease